MATTNSTPPDAGAGTSTSPAVRPPRRQAAVRRPATSARLAREARQTRLAYLSLFAVTAVIIIVLVVGILWQYVISPGQAVATVNGTSIRSDAFGRFQGYETSVLNNQLSSLGQYAAQPGLAQYVTQQENQVKQNLANIKAYTLQAMEQAVEVQQAAAKSGFAPTLAQIDAEFNKQRTRYDTNAKTPGTYDKLLGSIGVTNDDIKTFVVVPSLVQANVTKHYQGTAPVTQPWVQARNISVSTATTATLLQKAVLANPPTFGSLAQKYSTDNGATAGQVLTGTALLQAHAASSAYNGGWLKDASPAAPTQVISTTTVVTSTALVHGVKTIKKTNQLTPLYRTWLTPQTSGLDPTVLKTVEAMKPGQVKTVQGADGWHVLRVDERKTHTLTKAERTAILTQNGQQGYSTWLSNATSASKNTVNPPNPQAQFPAAAVATP